MQLDIFSLFHITVYLYSGQNKSNAVTDFTLVFSPIRKMLDIHITHIGSLVST